MALNILIIGAGCAGPALAIHLQKTNPKHNITVIERAPSLRQGGQQIDFKSHGVDIARAMGVLEKLKDKCVTENGMHLVDKNGKTLMDFGINDHTVAQQGLTLTAEYEIMRGDMVKVFHDESIAERQKFEKSGEKEGGLRYKFSTTATQFQNSDNGVDVTFSDGEKQRFDLVVGADGQNSRTRRAAFGADVDAACWRPVGVQAAYYEIPRIASDPDHARIYFAPGGRMFMVRGGPDRPHIQIYLFLMKDKVRHEHFKTVHRLPLDQQKEAWAEAFHDAGWESKRMIQGMATTSNFYAHEIGQVHLSKVYTGRIVLLGDAGYCPAPLTGLGTTSSLVGSYVLAGELAKHGNNVNDALEAYNEVMQAMRHQFQQLKGGAQVVFFPSSYLGLTLTNTALWLMSSFKIDKLLFWASGFLPESKDEFHLPVYPQLSLDEVHR